MLARVGQNVGFHDPTIWGGGEERPLHGTVRKGTETLTRPLMSASMFASTECARTELAFVLFIGDVLRLRRFGGRCDRRCGSCRSRRHCNTMILKASTSIPRVKRKRLSDTGRSMSMDWTYAK